MKRRRFNDVSFEVPEAWVDLSVVTLVGRDARRFAPNLVITREDRPKVSLPEYAKSGVEDLRRSMKKYELVSERAASVADHDGYVLEHRFMTPERVVVRQTQYFVLGARDVIAVSLTCDEREVDARAENFEAIVKSLVIRDQ